MHTYNPSTQEPERKEDEFETSLGNAERLSVEYRYIFLRG